MKLYLLKNRTNLRDNGYTLEEEAEIYDYLLQEVLNNPRYYLDNLDSFTLFRVTFGNYDNEHCITIPYRYSKKYSKTVK